MKLEFEICKYAKRIKTSYVDVVFYQKKLGKNPPSKIPFLQKGEIYLATTFDSETTRMIPNSKSDLNNMYNCLSRKEGPDYFLKGSSTFVPHSSQNF